MKLLWHSLFVVLPACSSEATDLDREALGRGDDLVRGTGVCEKNVHLHLMLQVPLDSPCPQFQCCQAVSEARGARMDVFFAAGSTRPRCLPNIEIGGRGG